MNNKLETITNLFEEKEIRSVCNSEKEDYYFSVVDVISALTNSNIPRNYWSDLKRKLKDEGSQLHENIVQLKMKSKKDGKNYLTDISEIAARDIAREEKPQGLKENIKVAKRGGRVAKGARALYEKETKKSAISKDNTLNYQYIDDKNIDVIENK